MNYIKSLLFIFLIYSCSSNTSHEQASANVTAHIANDTFSITVDSVQKLDWDKLEEDVFAAINLVENSTDANRKERILSLAKYSDKVDGAVAEGFFAFAFDYPSQNPELFFPVFSLSDSLFIQQWASFASMEFSLVLTDEQTPQVLVDKFKMDFYTKAKSLDEESKTLCKHFSTHLILSLKQQGFDVK